MASYNAQKIFNWDRPESPAVVTVAITSGTVAVEKPAGATWVVAYTFSASGSQSLWLGRGRFRVTPSATAVYEVD